MRSLTFLLAACAGAPPDEIPPTPEPPCEARAWYSDTDGDGHGARLAPVWACEARGVPEPSDCDDDRADVRPGAEEVCDGVDNDCSGAADEAWDADGDGVAACAGDCDDADPRRRPGFPETCNRIDDDCDGVVDGPFDLDGDGFATCQGDCDDASADVHPGAEEACNGRDDDCDPETSDDGDIDGDGLSRCDGDCDDLDDRVLPGREEVCDGVDNNCDGALDDRFDCYGCDRQGDYWYCSAAATWAQAAMACELGRAQLVQIDDEAENQEVSVNAAPLGSAWIGLSDTVDEGFMRWLDGTDPVFAAWWPGEPNDAGGNEDCISTNFGDVGWWNDWPCDTYLPFVCERP